MSTFSSFSFGGFMTKEKRLIKPSIESLSKLECAKKNLFR
jgi:hypothetical protein